MNLNEVKKEVQQKAGVLSNELMINLQISYMNEGGGIWNFSGNKNGMVSILNFYLDESENTTGT